MRGRLSGSIARGLVSPIHGRMVSGGRVAALSRALADLLGPEGKSILDVGAGSGEIMDRLRAARPRDRIFGADIMLRPGNKSVIPFDGERLPFRDKSVDACLLVDVLHHCPDPRPLLAECKRVAREAILIKDHFAESSVDKAVLSAMDWVGNRGHGVGLEYNYLSRREWESLFASLGLAKEREIDRVQLYPWPLQMIFGRGLHFIARLRA